MYLSLSLSFSHSFSLSLSLCVYMCVPVQHVCVCVWWYIILLAKSWTMTTYIHTSLNQESSRSLWQFFKNHQMLAKCILRHVTCKTLENIIHTHDFQLEPIFWWVPTMLLLNSRRINTLFPSDLIYSQSFNYHLYAGNVQVCIHSLDFSVLWSETQPQ